MRDDIQRALKAAQDLVSVETNLIKLLESIHAQKPGTKIGFVCGLISSEGREYIEENMSILASYVEKIRERERYPVFSSADVFTPETYTKVNLADRTNQEFIELWRGIFRSRFLTDIFFTPRWEKSEGAVDENNTAKELGLNIHYEE